MPFVAFCLFVLAPSVYMLLLLSILFWGLVLMFVTMYVNCLSFCAVNFSCYFWNCFVQIFILIDFSFILRLLFINTSGSFYSVASH